MGQALTNNWSLPVSTELVNGNRNRVTGIRLYSFLDAEFSVTDSNLQLAATHDFKRQRFLTPLFGAAVTERGTSGV